MKQKLICLILLSFFNLYGADELSIVLSESENTPDGYLQLWLNSIYPEDSQSFGSNSQGMNYFNEDYWALSREYDVKLISDPNSFSLDFAETLTDDEVVDRLFDLGYTLPLNCYSGDFTCDPKVGGDFTHFSEITSDGSFLYTEFFFTYAKLNNLDYENCVWYNTQYADPPLSLAEAEGLCRDTFTTNIRVYITLKIAYNNGSLFLADYAKGDDVALFYNYMDDLVYYQSGVCVNNSYIDLNGFSKDLNGSPSMPPTMKIVRLNFNENQDCNQHSIFQGGAFSPNGRFFIKVTDTFNIDGIHDYSGLYIFEIDGIHLDPLSEKYYRDLNSSNDILNYNFVQFINFRYDGSSILDTFGEMEGIDIFPTDSRGDIHGLYIHNEIIDDSSIYHITSLKDTDSDGIKDIYDNCPYDSNEFQEDRDNNKVGDVCDDFDQDGIFDAYDNCVETDNNDQADWNNDNIGDACQDSDNDGLDDIDDNCVSIPNSNQADYDEDGVGDACDNCPDDFNSFELAENPYSELIIKGAVARGNGFWFAPKGHLEKTLYKWQPDHDMDGVGDVCDLKTAAGNDGYSISMSWKSKNSLVSYFGQNSEGKFFELNKVVGVLVSGGYFDPVNTILDGFHRVHYCGLDLFEYCTTGINPEKTGCNPGGNRWAGLCQTEAVSGREFGRSHATVDNPSFGLGERWPHIAWADTWNNADKINYTNVGLYKQPIPAPQNKSKSTPSAYWNWRADIFAQYACQDDENVDIYAICENILGKIKENTPIYYNLSSNFAGNSNQYITVGGDVNPDYFKNNFTGGSFTDAGIWGMATRLNTGKAELQYKAGVSLLTPDELKNSHKEFISQLVISGEAPNVIVPVSALIFDDISFIKYRNGGYIKTSDPDYSLVSSEISFAPKTKQLIEGDRPGVTYAITETGDDVYSLSVNYAPSSDWHILGTVFNYGSYDLEWSSATIHDRTIYLSSKDEAAPSAPVYRIIRNGNDYEIQYVLRMPLDGASDIRLVSAMGNLYFFEDSNGVLKTWSVDLDTDTYAEITAGLAPAYIRPFNIIGTETGIYIMGKYDPSDPGNTIIAKLSDSNGWQIVQSGVNAETGKLIMNVIDGKLVMTDIFSDNPMTTRTVLDMTDDSVIVEEIETPDIYGIEEISGSYCLNETDDVLKGGLEVSGECTPFTHPWYRSFATGSTIYSVAGKGDRLYVGTNTSIKVYDISDPEAFVLKYTFSTDGRVYDLEVAEDNVMYAATSGGIYKLDTTDPDTLSQTSFYSTGYNYQYRIRLYNNLLYVGDDNGINIRDKETFALLSYVDVGAVLDFAISEGEIAMYRSSFWSAGIQIRDVETLNMKAWEYAECYTGELTADHGEFYLSCDGYEYRFEGRPDTYIDFYSVVGDMLEMQENHVYNGWTYIPDGSNVKLSTLNDVPSYCGNGVVEEGELCDGNSVACTTLDPDYVSGTAYCNSTCDGYNEGNCEEDGW